MINPDNAITTFLYYNLGRKAAVEYPLGNLTTTVYDSDGR